VSPLITDSFNRALVVAGFRGCLPVYLTNCHDDRRDPILDIIEPEDSVSTTEYLVAFGARAVQHLVPSFPTHRAFDSG